MRRESPAHNSLATWGLSGEGEYSLGNEPVPYWRGVSRSIDAHGEPRDLEVRRWSWLVGETAASDSEVLDLAESFANPPRLEILEGGRVDLPAYVPERRALRILVEGSRVRLRLTPQRILVNPIFELVDAPPDLANIEIDGVPLEPDEFAWSSEVLWMQRIISGAAELSLEFRAIDER